MTHVVLPHAAAHLVRHVDPELAEQHEDLAAVVSLVRDLVGKEVSGVAHAEADLYRGKTFVLTPLARTSPAALALAHELIEAIGARPLVLSAERHDALAAVSSHLPYVVAAELKGAAGALHHWRI